MSTVPDDAGIRDARARYFREHRLGEDGGYSARWVKFRIGPIVIPMPNTPARVAALPLHDLHHLATGYDTSWAGEAEIAAWELGAGCGRYIAAWLLNLAAMPIGLVIAPRRTWRAFLRGRSTRTLYDERWDPAWLDTTVGALRARLGLLAVPRRARVTDVLLFAACVAPVAIVVALAAAAVRAWLA